MKWIGPALMLFGLNAALSGGGNDDLVVNLYVLTFAVIIFFAGRAVTIGVFQDEQRKVDKRALAILGTPEIYDGQLFSLYLRPFDIGGKFLNVGTYSFIKLLLLGPVLSGWGLITRPGKDALERVLADAVERTAPLVGLGGHEAAELGPGSAGFMSDWKDRIPKVIKISSYIFIVPSAHEGTLWEIGEIKHKGHFHKAVFIMPRTDRPFKYSGTRDYKLVWDEARAACEREHGIDLPKYTSKGALFRFDEQMKVCQVELTKSSPREVAKAINRLFEATPQVPQASEDSWGVAVKTADGKEWRNGARFKTEADATTFIKSNVQFELTGYVTGHAVHFADAPNCSLVWASRRAERLTVIFPEGKRGQLEWVEAVNRDVAPAASEPSGA
jgi:hypothetical protein